VSQFEFWSSFAAHERRHDSKRAEIDKHRHEDRWDEFDSKWWRGLLTGIEKKNTAHSQSHAQHCPQSKDHAAALLYAPRFLAGLAASMIVHRCSK
jgi:hypothetical protein